MNFWDERYSSTEYVYGTEPNDFLKVHAGLIAPGGRVLCIAEGEGRNAVYLAGLGFEVLAVDQSAVGLQKAMDLAQKKGVSITTAIASLEDYLIPEGELTNQPCAMPDQYKSKNVVDSYRTYYIKEKSSFAKWEKGTPTPKWFIEGISRLSSNYQQPITDEDWNNENIPFVV